VLSYVVTEAVQVIWTLSFDKENRSEMVNNKDWAVIETLDKLKQSTDYKIRDMSKKALWTMQDRGNNNLIQVKPAQAITSFKRSPVL
jgi:hypothetical protein